MKAITLTIEWDTNNRRHFAETGRCTARQVEEILLSTCHGSRRRRQKQRNPRKNVRYRYEGQTCRGRYLVVIAEQIDGGTLRPVTCWPLVDVARKGYLAWRRTTKSR